MKHGIKRMMKAGIKGILPQKIVDQIYFQYQIWLERWVWFHGDSVAYLEKWYQKRTGYPLDLSNPKTFTAKQQWLKLYGQSERKTKCADKWQVRAYVAEKLGPEVLIPVISNNGKDSFQNPWEIDYDQLPDRFVIQCSHGSGMTFVVENKRDLGEKGFRRLQRMLSRCLKRNYAFGNGLELVYKDIKPVIFITKYLSSGDGLPDYKFMCFHGQPQFLWIDTGRFTDHRRRVYNLDFTPAPFTMARYKSTDVEKPEELENMIRYAQILAEDFPDCVRVDFYYAQGQIWFGELTFSSSSGTEVPQPPEWDLRLGEMLRLPCDGDKERDG